MKFNKLNKFSKKKLIIISLIGIVVLLAIVLTFCFGNESKEEYISYKEFNTKLENNEISVVLIEDDIVKFKNGKQISADCIIIEGEAEVNESLLTGESVAVEKNGKTLKKDKLPLTSLIKGPLYNDSVISFITKLPANLYPCFVFFTL